MINIKQFLDEAVAMSTLLNLPVGVPFKVPKCSYEKLIGTLVTISVVNGFCPMRFIAQFDYDKELLTITKLTEGALREDGTDYLEQKER